jgi:hypothetical protein
LIDESLFHTTKELYGAFCAILYDKSDKIKALCQTGKIGELVPTLTLKELSSSEAML